jgi:hypothetical protein
LTLRALQEITNRCFQASMLRSSMSGARSTLLVSAPGAYRASEAAGLMNSVSPSIAEVDQWQPSHER